MKLVILTIALPFATIIISVLLVCAVAVSPFFLIGYIWSTRQKKERRESEYYPKQKTDLKSMIESYKKTREVRK
jgi:hypothetical protein